MERLLIHVKANRFDFIGITKMSRSYKLETIKQSAKAMAVSLIK
jgi:hypothetical protein